MKVQLVTRKDLEISNFCGSGKGGQNKQKNATGVQIKHIESGAIGRCSETRSQFQNRKKAFLNLCETPKMKLWLSKKLYELQQNKTIDEVVEEMMQPKYLRTQIKENGRWIDAENLQV